MHIFGNHSNKKSRDTLVMSQMAIVGELCPYSLKVGGKDGEKEGYRPLAPPSAATGIVAKSYARDWYIIYSYRTVSIDYRNRAVISS